MQQRDLCGQLEARDAVVAGLKGLMGEQRNETAELVSGAFCTQLAQKPAGERGNACKCSTPVVEQMNPCGYMKERQLHIASCT